MLAFIQHLKFISKFSFFLVLVNSKALNKESVTGNS